MRIAQVTATFPPYWAGTGNVAFHNARLLHERGHEVVVFTAAMPRDATLEFPFRVERLPVVFRIGNAPFTPNLMAELRGFDVIHLHYPYIFGAELALLAAKRFRTPLVLTYHNQLQETSIYKRALFSAYNLTSERILLRGAEKILAVRREHLLSVHPGLAGASRVQELPNGVDTAAFSPTGRQEARRNLGLPAHDAIALFVGALDQAHRFKNVDGLLRAFARVTVENASLLIVGEGGRRAWLESVSEDLGLSDRVFFLGSRKPHQLPEIYSAADVTVLPSTSVESFGLVLVESMACGTPVILSRLPGVRTVIESGREGLVVTPGDEGDLAEKLQALLADRPLSERMGRCARIAAVQRYDWRRAGTELERAYESVLTRRAAA